MSEKVSTQQQLFTLDIARLITKASELGIGLTFGEAYRTQDQQELYYFGKTVRREDAKLELINGTRRSKTLNSNHLRRMAVDFNFFIDGKLTYQHDLIEQLGVYWESLSPGLNRWGGHFLSWKDIPHFERVLV